MILNSTMRIGRIILWLSISIASLSEILAASESCADSLLAIALEKNGHIPDEQIRMQLRKHLQEIEKSQQFTFPIHLFEADENPPPFNLEWRRLELENIFQKFLILQWLYVNTKLANFKFEILNRMHDLLSDSYMYKLVILKFPFVANEEEYRAWKLDQTISEQTWEDDPYLILEKIYLDEEILRDLNRRFRSSIIGAMRERGPEYCENLSGCLRAYMKPEDIPELIKLAAEMREIDIQHFILRVVQKIEANQMKQNIASKIRRRFFDPLQVPKNSVLRIRFSEWVKKYSEDSYENAKLINDAIKGNRVFLIAEDYNFFVHEATKENRRALAIALSIYWHADIPAKDIKKLTAPIWKRLRRMPLQELDQQEIFFLAEYGELEEAEKYFTELRNRISLNSSPQLLDEIVLILKDRRDGQYEYRYQTREF